MYAKYIKRILDFVLSLMAVIVLSPLMIVIGFLVKITSKGPAFFLQERLGKDGKVFKIIKFRTMVQNAEKIGPGIRVTGENDFRITKIGKILRKTSLDELPQLINVLIGQMSLVGPRPPVTYSPHYYEEYPDFQKARFSIRPGITGLAQIILRNNGTWDERIELDLEYLKKITFVQDLKIIFKTVLKILKCESVYRVDKNVQVSNEKERILK